jgi:Copper transport outer membrane protein, MctB
VIDFRYHLVSIVAVFLALAIGIVLGSTELQGNTIDVLRTSSNQLKNELDLSNAQRDTSTQQVKDDLQFLAAAEPRMLANELPGDRIVIITEPGAPDSVISGIKQAAGLAGATVTGEVALQPAFNDLSGASQSKLSAINGSLALTDQTALPTPTAQQTASQQQAAQLIGTAILATTSAGESAGISSADGQTLLGAYAQAGYLTITDTPYDRATLAVIVAPQTAPTDGQNDPANQVLLAVAQEFAPLSAATIVVGSTDGSSGSSGSGSAISVLRSSSLSSQVSSVDNADTTVGQVTTMWALANQLGGAKPNSYGISGAALNPVPLAVPSATPTVAPTPRPTKMPPAKKGKGGKPVKPK